jgi:YHS domain-containing protein
MEAKTGTAKTQCPVCRYVIDDTSRPVEIGKRVFIVCCEDCERKIRANPEKYIRAK